jgi:hypothetical protein
MKTFVTVPVTITSSKEIRQPRAVSYRLASKRSLLRRFQHFIVSTDWEKRYLYNHWINKMCLRGIVASMIYFTPLLMSILWAM